ncbi:GDP-mannose 4,6-dehydratase [Elusimicrobiota bacterium]
MKKILITGGAGFIGSHLAERLLDTGYEVSILDDLSTGSKSNVSHLAKNPNFHTYWNSVFDTDALKPLVYEADIVFHMAASVGVCRILERPVETIENNVGGTSLVLKTCLKNKTKVFIASTSEVYGKNDQVPLRETDDGVLGPTVNSRWNYACSKAIDEFLSLAYYKESKLPVVIVRFFNTVGSRQTGRYGMVIPRFTTQALSGEPITVYGDGEQTRSFTDVEDIINGLILLNDCKNAVGQVFNIGSGMEISIGDLAQKIKQMTGSSSSITHVPYRIAYEAGFEDLRRRVPDITKVNKLTGYKPKVDFEETLKRIIEYHRLKQVVTPHPNPLPQGARGSEKTKKTVPA